MKTVYSDIKLSDGTAARIGATLCHDDESMVMVHRVNGGRIGAYKIERFGGELTASTLKSLFNGGSTR